MVTVAEGLPTGSAWVNALPKAPNVPGAARAIVLYKATETSNNAANTKSKRASLRRRGGGVPVLPGLGGALLGLGVGVTLAAPTAPAPTPAPTTAAPIAAFFPRSRRLWIGVTLASSSGLLSGSGTTGGTGIFLVVRPLLCGVGEKVIIPPLSACSSALTASADGGGRARSSSTLSLLGAAGASGSTLFCPSAGGGCSSGGCMECSPA